MKGGRPPTVPVTFRDGFYFEVRNRDTEPGQGVKLRKDTKKEMLEAVQEYRRTKFVTILGEYKNGKPVKKR